MIGQGARSFGLFSAIMPPYMSIRFHKPLLRYLSSDRYQPANIPALAEALRVDPALLPLFEKAVAELLTANKIVASGGNLSLAMPGPQITGIYRGNEKGFGFLMPDEPVLGGDLFVPPGCSADAMDGDRVLCNTKRDSRGKPGDAPGTVRFLASVLEIVERTKKPLTGMLTKKGANWIVEVDGRKLSQPAILVRDIEAKNAKGGDKVVVEIIKWSEDSRQLSEGVITRVVGAAGEPDAETAAIMAAYGLDEEFPEDVLAQARLAADKMKDPALLAAREDCRGWLTCTIDPPDAKDYDDALAIRKLAKPNKDGALWEVAVHIADVASFVEPGSVLDIEARRRANSTYLPRRVVPMLPEVLSNGVCSLQEGVERFALTAFIGYDEDGTVVSQRFASTLIKSARRFTYLEAQGVIDGKLDEAAKHCKTDPVYSPEVVECLQNMNELSRVIRRRRLASGMIVLHLPAVELKFDASGRVVDAHPEDDAFTHTLIEMFMVEANEAAARLFFTLGVPMVRRNHGEPDPMRLADLEQVARSVAVNLPAKPGRKDLQKLLDTTRGTPKEQAVHMAVLRCMMRAEYGPEHIGHFALASEHYTHFTSPIRRYPDFVVHRGLKAAIEACEKAKIPCAFGLGKGKPADKKRIGAAIRSDKRVPDEQGMAEVGTHCSLTERNSAEAERELRKFLVIQFLSGKIGESFEATVTGTMGAGAFFQIDQFLVDGMVPCESLPGSGRWTHDPRTNTLQSPGRVIGAGDRFIVKITRVDMARRQLTLDVVEPIKGGSHRQLTVDPSAFANPARAAQAAKDQQGRGPRNQGPPNRGPQNGPHTGSAPRHGAPGKPGIKGAGKKPGNFGGGKKGGGRGR